MDNDDLAYHFDFSRLSCLDLINLAKASALCGSMIPSESAMAMSLIYDLMNKTFVGDLMEVPGECFQIVFQDFNQSFSVWAKEVGLTK